MIRKRSSQLIGGLGIGAVALIFAGCSTSSQNAAPPSPALSSANMDRNAGADVAPVPCFPNCANQDFSGQDLSGKDLANGDFTKAKFNNAILKGTIFYQAKLPGTDLSGADAEEAVFDGADLTKANLTNTRAVKAHFFEAKVKMANLKYFNGQEAEFPQTDFSRANFDSAYLPYANFTGANFTDAVNLRSALFGSDGSWVGATCPNGKQGPYPCV